jgi:ATP-dependent DNA helicase RecQ
VLGHDDLRPGQGPAIRALIEGRDTLAVMPTGSGKSAIYQLAAHQLAGGTVVVSPLIALQRDQLEELDELEVGRGATLNSQASTSKQEEALAGFADGSIEFLFLAPEQLARHEVVERVAEAKPSLFVVDEAHCISDWGHDFRPEYLRLGSVVEALAHPQVLALTATASAQVRAEIVERLGMRDPLILVEGFDRPNIWLGVERQPDERARQRALAEAVVAAEKPGIVYTATRRVAEDLAERLTKQGVNACAYHAGLRRTERDETQRAFMDDEIEVIVATVAFGMGVDKPNVRFVFHAQLSDSLDGYHQEIGRAGRDGEPARACLFYRPEDLPLRRFLGTTGRLSADQLEPIVSRVLGADEPLQLETLSGATDMSKSALDRAVNRLQAAGALEILPDGRLYGTSDASPEELARQAEEADERRRRVERSRLEMMRGYAELRDCRRRYLLDYFGESVDGPCGNCDQCDAGRAVERSDGVEPFPVDGEVVHNQLGAGRVVRYEEDKVVVLFDEYGYRTLSLELIAERDLLHSADGISQLPARDEDLRAG